MFSHTDLPMVMREQVIGVKEFIYFIKNRYLVYIYLINMGRLTYGSE